MGGMIESVLEKDGRDGNKFWIAIIDGVETMAFNAEIKGLKGKECPYPIGMSKNGKPYIQFPKAGGFTGKSGGGWKGKSDKELYLQALTMTLSYAKDVAIAELESGAPSFVMQTYVLDTYKAFSKAILADLKVLCPDVPEAPKTEAPKPAPSTPVQQATTDLSPAAPLGTMGGMTPKQKLESEMHKYLAGMKSDTPENFRTLLMDLTGFPGKDRETGELTGRMVCIEDINDKKFSDKWALTSYGKLKKLKEEQEISEHFSAGKDESDINF